MQRIYAIAINTFREAVRDRVLLGVLGLASAVLLFTIALGELSLEQQARVVMDVGLASISLFSVVVAIFLGSSLLYKEIERKTLYVILPKPIARHEFLLGKYFGIVLTGAVFILLMGAIQLWVVALQGGASTASLSSVPVGAGLVLGLAMWKAKDRTAVLLPYGAGVLLAASLLCASADVSPAPVLYALLLNVGEVLVLAAVAILFSSFSTPFLTGMFTLGVWVVGRAADDMVAMTERQVGPEIKSLLSFVAEVAPNLNLFVPGTHTLTTTSPELGPPWLYVATSMGYAALYSAVLLTLAALIFRRRDFL